MIRRIVLLGLIVTLPLAAEILTESFELRLAKAVTLVSSNTPKAVAALEELLKERPDDAKALYQMGMALATQGHQLDHGVTRQETMQKSRAFIVRARQAGMDDPIIATILKEINPDGTENGRRYANNNEADRLYQQAEAAFQKRNFAEAQKHYQAVLDIEPTNYMARMGVGDTFFARGNFKEAADWFEKAGALEPDKEIAYRYWGDALLRLGKRNEALEKYLSAVIAEPYNGYPRRALAAGCQALLLKPWMAAAKLPLAEVKDGSKGPEILLPKGFNALHVVYTTARAQWQTENKARRFPAGTAYRHTLEEEIHALSLLIKIHGELKQSGQPPPAELATALAEAESSIAELAEIEKAGLLPAHVFFFRADQDIAQDYPAYREANREKLREYLWKYYLHLP